MHLRTKVFLYIGGALAILFFVVYSSLSSILTNDFRDLEKQSVEENVRRVADAFDNRVDDLAVKVSDWGQWDDTYTFVQDQNQEYSDTNLQDVALELLQIQFIVITNEQGEILFKKQIDQEGKETSFSESFESYIKTHPALTKHAERQSVHSGIIVLPEGVIVNVARAVTSSDGLSPVEGTIMFAFFVDDTMAEKLALLTHLKVTLLRYDDAMKQPDFTLAAKGLENEQGIFIGPRNDDEKTVYGYAFKNDINGERALLMRIELERSLYQRGQESMVLFTRIMLGVGVFIIIVVFYLFEILVLRRLFHLGKAVEEVSRNQDNQSHIFLPGKDEFSSLAERINAMLVTLREMEVKKKESENRFRTVADLVPVMIWMIDTDKKCTYVNKVWLDFTGRTVDKELGIGWTDMVHPDDMKKSWPLFETAFEQRKPFTVEWRMHHFDGTDRWLFMQIIPNFAEGKLFLGYIGSAIDISERKDVEEKRDIYIKDIERMNRLMVNREIKMAELKKEIEGLKSRGTPPLT